MSKIIRGMLMIALVLSCAAVGAIEIPKASAKALGVTKGKAFSSGLVFVNGKYIEPPYVVERWGNGIRINSIPVVGQVVDWTDFLKTQSGVKITKSEAPAAAPVEEDPPDDLDDDLDDDMDSSLDDLFDDEPKPKKEKKPAKKKAKPRAPKPVATVSYTLEGDFVPNDASKALVARVNRLRTDINTKLLNDGVIFFGDGYQRMEGGSRLAEEVLARIPEMQKRSTDAAALTSQVRSAGMLYLSAPICADLFDNRRDYSKLMSRRNKWKEDRQLQNMLNGSGRTSSF